MFNLTAAIKAKIGTYSQEYLSQATNKCQEAGSLVQKAAETNDPELMFKAVEIYIEAIKIYPKLIEPYLSIAYICWKFNKFDDSIMLLNQAIEIDPLSNNARNMLAKISKEKKNNNFSKLKAKYKSDAIPLSDQIKAKTKPQKGLFSKILDLFSFGSNKNSRPEPIPVPKKKDDFAESLAEFSKMMSYEQLKIKVDKNTLNRMAGAMSNKEATPHTVEKPNIDRTGSMNDFNKEQLEHMNSHNKEKLHEKRESLSKEQFIVRVNSGTFSKITKKL
jgi:tetratricopeptide (TPR) repeat protein